jgi:hypothetical protein
VLFPDQFCITAPSKTPKPSAQTQILLEKMASSADDEKDRWSQVMENFDLLYARLNDMGIVQQEVKQQLTDTTRKVEQCTADQRFIAQQVQANGQAVAQLTLKQFEHEDGSVSYGSVVADDDTMFENMFAKGKTTNRGEPSHQFKHRPPPRKESLPHHTLPKMHFPAFDGVQPKIWLDKCHNYFSIYSIAEYLWVEAATMHLQENAAKWWQTYKISHPAVTWKQFIVDIQDTFGSDDYRSALNELFDLKQASTMEEYTTQFKSLQYDVSMHGGHYDDLFFATQSKEINSV